MNSGSCLCGAIKFEFDAVDVVESVCCFCSNCRKVSGSQFGIYLQVKRPGFRWISGEDETTAYESSPGNKRAFCKTCGSVAPIVTAYGAVRVPGGAVDDDPGISPSVAIYERSKAGWCASESARQTFQDAGPREFWIGIIERLHGMN